MKRADILDEAKQYICRDREHEYGTPEDNFSTIGYLWSTYLRAAHPDLAKVLPLNGITPKDVAVMMSLLKVARIATGKNSTDSFVDLAGYAALAGEIAVTYEVEQKKHVVNENRCVVCDSVIPEGTQVCVNCSKLNRRCKKCGTYYPLLMLHCPNCETDTTP